MIRAHLLPAFGSRPIEDITNDDIERWKVGLGVDSGMSNATKLKILTILSGAFERARKVPLLNLLLGPLPLHSKVNHQERTT